MLSYVLRDYVVKTLRPNLYDYLKIFAVCTMIIDHVGFFLFPHISWLRFVGRLSFPVFLFLVWFNWSYKRDWRLWFFWLVVQIPFVFVYLKGYVNDHALNILLWIGFVRLFLFFFHRFAVTLSSLSRMFLFLLSLVVFLLLFPYTYPIFDYGSMILVFGLLGYFFRFYMISHHHELVFLWVVGLLVFCFHYFTQFHNFGNYLSDLQRFFLSLLYLLELQLFVVLSEKNYSLFVSEKFNRVLIYLSSRALEIYVLHIVLLSYLRFVFVNK